MVKRFRSILSRVVALHVVAVAVKQAGGDEGRAHAFADKAAALMSESAGQNAGDGTLTVTVELGPPIQVKVGGQTLTLPPHEPS